VPKVVIVNEFGIGDEVSFGGLGLWCIIEKNENFCRVSPVKIFVPIKVVSEALYSD
jgi:hypothetical protein